eukprot:3879326-Rhodomonas_salina.1
MQRQEKRQRWRRCSDRSSCFARAQRTGETGAKTGAKMGAETARVQALRLEGRLCKGAETLQMQFCLCGSYADGMQSVWQGCRGDGIDAEGKADCVAAMQRGKLLCGSNAEGCGWKAICVAAMRRGSVQGVGWWPGGRATLCL